MPSLVSITTIRVIRPGGHKTLPYLDRGISHRVHGSRFSHVQSRERRRRAAPSFALRKGRCVPTIYLDADACPVKEQVYRVAARYGMPLIVVANARIRIPEMAGLNATLTVVPGSLDAADDWIAESAQAGDLVLTADIPLAARAIAKGITCLDFRGGEFHPIASAMRSPPAK